MKKNTIKWRIFRYNLIVIIMLVALVTIIFNVAIRVYFERDIVSQLGKIASRTEDTALRKGPGLFHEARRVPLPPEVEAYNELLKFYFMLDRSLREPLSVLNADYILLDKDKNRISPLSEELFAPSAELLDRIAEEVRKSKNLGNEAYLSFTLSGTEYVAITKPVSQSNSIGLGWIIIYSSLQKVNQLQCVINLMLFAILIFSALVIMIFSSLASKKISAPFSSLNQHISAIAERNFGAKIHMPVYEELQDVVNNINIMSEKLETYDKAQKTFLQNASHEFRTPLMSIQSYAEGIKYGVVDHGTAVDIILDETKRMTHLVEELLYLSRLDTIEENYHFQNLDYREFINGCVERMNRVAMKNGIRITVNTPEAKMEIQADEEKLSRAITNIIGNCIRYANQFIVISSNIIDNGKVKLTISDDGPGFEPGEIPNIFERFFKGKKGVFGLGLAISKNVIERHNGKITAENSGTGALFTIKLPVICK